MFFTPPQPAENKVVTVPAPIGGLNARDPLTSMPETDAVSMDNFWPQPYGVAVRRGYREWVTGVTDAVKTVAFWNDVDGSEKILAWGAGEVYDITTEGPVGAALLDGFANDLWQYVVTSNAAGSHLIAVNGADDALLYNASGLQEITAGDGIVANTWAGLTPSSAIQLAVYQSRIWAVKENSAVAYYLPPDVIYGTFESVDFGPLFQRGGYLMFLATWSVDDGSGAEDRLVAVSSTGSAVVFSGGDPADDQTWRQVGMYFIGAPVKGRRCYTKVGGDLLILTTQGVVSMNGQLASAQVADRESSLVSDKIQYLLSRLINQYFDSEGWQLTYVPSENMLIVNVPSAVSGGNFQLVSNQLIGSWAQFSGMDAINWATGYAGTFFGAFDGTIYRAFDGYYDKADEDGLNGNDITAECLQAYSYFGALGQTKQVGLYRPNLLIKGTVSFGSRILYDWKLRNSEIVTPAGESPVGGIWDTDLWVTSLWGGDPQAYRPWLMGAGWGTAAAIALTLSATNETLWISTDYSYTVGGIL